MTEGWTKCDVVKAVEALMLEKFETEPFHNLYVTHGFKQTTRAYGGTCSDKTLSFCEAVQALGVPATLHTARIGGAEIHRLAKLRLEGRTYFADVGNGWPSTELYPADRASTYSCFGMRFRSVVSRRGLCIYNSRNGTERHQMEIPFDGKPEREILADIESRFASGIEYPFSRGVRFSQVIGERFLFLRDDRLEIYSDAAPFREIGGLSPAQLPHTLERYFGFDIEVLASPPSTGEGER